MGGNKSNSAASQPQIQVLKSGIGAEVKKVGF